MASTAPESGETAHSGPDRLLVDAADVARHADARLSAALNDLFMPDFVRPTDSQRTAMANMLSALVEEIEHDLRHALVQRLGETAPPVLGVTRIPIVRPIFDRAGVLRDRDLVSLLLTRVEEHRITSGLRRVAEFQPEFAPTLAPSGQTGWEAAMLVAEGRRHGPSGEPRLAKADLSAELLHRMLWWAAAALRDYLERTSELDPATRDEALSVAVAAQLVGHDEGQTLEAAAMRAALASRGGDDQLFEAFRVGRFSLFVAVIAVRARLDFSPAFLMASDPSIGALAVLLRAVDVSTEVAAPILLQMAAVNGVGDAKLEERIGDFLDLELSAAHDAIRPWRLDRAFRNAIVDIGRERRQR
jgi:hypothetical protein